MHHHQKRILPREKRVVRLREKDKLTFPEIGVLFGVTHQRASQIYASASARLKDVSKNGSDALLLLPPRVRMLLMHCGIRSRSRARAAIKSGQLRWQDRFRCVRWLGKVFPKVGKRTWAILYEWAGKPVLPPQPTFVRGYPANGLSSRANDFLNHCRIPATKAAITLALSIGALSPDRCLRNYGPSLHAELCRWVGVDPRLSKTGPAITFSMRDRPNRRR